MKTKILLISSIAGVLLLLGGCQSSGKDQNSSLNSSNRSSTSQETPHSSSINCRALKFKKTIAVSRFKSKVRNYKGGRAMADMLTDALIQTGQYVVLERQALWDVLTEQDFAARPRTPKTLKSAQTGKVIPAQLLITGTISEYSSGSGSSRSGFSVKGFKIGSGSSESHIGLIIRIIDTTSGQVIDSVRVEGKQKFSSLLSGACVGGVCGSSSSTASDTTAQATQIAIDRAVIQITQRTSNIPFVGKIISFKDGSIYTNIGERNGATIGDVFSVYSPGEELIDPDTVENLGTDNTKVGSLKLSSVKEKFSVALIKFGLDLRKGFILHPE